MRMVVITSDGGAPGRGHEDIALAALRAGCRAVQLRDKEMPDRAFAELARKVKAACGRYGALFFVNDRVDVAAAVGSDGVHLGADDLGVADARKLLTPGAIIGYSPEGLEDARRAVRAGADYLGVGPVFPTTSKPDAGGPIGLEGLAAFCGEALAPVVAVGGINADCAASVMAAGAAGVAVVSAVANAPDIEAAVMEIMEMMTK